MKFSARALLTVLVYSLSTLAFAGITDKNLQNIGSSLWKHKPSTLSNDQKNDLAIVYGGEDIARKITDNNYSV